MLYVIKKDGTREEFNPQKIVAAVNKSAERILYTFSDEEKDFICRFAQEHADSLGKNDIAALLAKAPIEAVFCNGAAAYRIYTKYLQPVSGIAAVKLPSTSPANAACRPETLRAVWGEALGPWISK